jgi:iron complex outermembrane receptor protein
VDLNYAGIDFVHGPDPTPSTSKAAFVQGTFHATDKMDITVGARYTQDEKDYTTIATIPTVPCRRRLSFPFAPTQPPNAVLAGLDGSTGHFESTRLTGAWCSITSGPTTS